MPFCILLCVLPRPVIYPVSIMPDRQLIAPSDIDWFCRNILPELVVFHRVISCGNRTDAAKMLGISPQAVGKSLARLENRLADIAYDAAIISRSKKIDVVPTEAGQLLLDFANEIISISKAFGSRFREFEFATSCCVAVDEPFAHSDRYRITGWLKAGNYKTIEFLQYAGADQMHKVYAAVKEGKAQIGFTTYPPKVTKPYAIEMLEAESIDLNFCPEKTAIHTQMELQDSDEDPFIALIDLVREIPSLRFVMQKQSASPSIHHVVTSYLRRLGVNYGPDQILRCETLQEVAQTLATYNGTVALLPHNFLNNPELSIRCRPLTPPLPNVPAGMIFHKNHSNRCVMLLRFHSDFHFAQPHKRGPKKRVPTLEKLGMTEEELEERFDQRSWKFR
jgi:DNA-binding transcriptional LysR family regulator